MQFKSVVTAALLGLAQAVDVQVVYVGMNPTSQEVSLKYYPEKLTAAVGTMVQFQFLAGNHTVTQSNFDNPCVPVSSTVQGATGIFSGAMDVAASQAQGLIPVYSIMIADESPLWLYCGTGPHCKNGMSMVINEPTAVNQTRSLENYKVAANVFEGASPPPAVTGTLGGSATVTNQITQPTQSLVDVNLPGAASGLKTPSAVLLGVVAAAFFLL